MSNTTLPPAPSSTNGTETRSRRLKLDITGLLGASTSYAMVGAPVTIQGLSPIVSGNTTDVTAPVITGIGLAGETINLYDGTIEVGTGTVQGSGTWSITTSNLTDGTHTLTAVEHIVNGETDGSSSPFVINVVDGTIDVASFSQLNAAIDIVNTATSGDVYTIDLTQNITETADQTWLEMDNGTSLTINGGGYTLDGADAYTGFVVLDGTVAIDNLTISDAVAQGGAGGAGTNGGGGGGGGGGLGGGLFIYAASVNLNGVNFSNDAARGGQGGSGASGTSGGGGGGGGTETPGGNPSFTSHDYETAGTGGSGGTNGGGSGGGYFSNVTGESGAFGGGGGGGFGGRYTPGSGGSGGFGGGGGGGGQNMPAGPGGFGGGAGAAGISGTGGAGGGGLGAGGDIFLAQGGSLTIGSGILAEGTVTGGTSATDGGAFGDGIFLQGTQDVTLAPGLGQTLTISGSITDQSGSGGSGTNAGVGGLIIAGAGTVVLAANNTFTGNTTLTSGTLVVQGGGGGAGEGDIVFTNGGTATLEFTTEDTPTINIEGFGTGDTIIVPDFTFAQSDSYTTEGNFIILNGVSSAIEAFVLVGAADETIYLSAANGGGTEITLQLPSAAPAGLTLAPASDSGVQGDDITNVTTPDIIGTGTPGETITLYAGTIAVGTGTVDNSGSWSIVSSILSAGTHDLTATQANDGGTISPPSAALDITIDTTTPPAPAVPALAPASDSGVLGDDITNVTTPDITGTGIAGDTITLYDGTIAIGTGTVDNSGTWSIVAGTPLTAGAQSFTAIQTDIAGNQSAASTPLDVTILTSAAAPTDLGLSPATDSGVLGDGLTDDVYPAITGLGAPGDEVKLYIGTYDFVIGTATVDNSGSWSITTDLPDGVFSFTATETDVAGNVSPSSLPFTLTIANAVIDVANEQQLNMAAEILEEANYIGMPGSYSIEFTQNITLTNTPYGLYPDAAPLGSTLTIDGNGFTLDGAGTYHGLIAYAEGGPVTIENLTIANAVAKGGSGGAGTGGGGGGGGGGGFGGGLLVYDTTGVGGEVTLDNVNFVNDAAVGGAGAAGSSGYSGGGGGGGTTSGNGSSGGSGGYDGYENPNATVGRGGTAGHHAGYAGGQLSQGSYGTGGGGGFGGFNASGGAGAYGGGGGGGGWGSAGGAGGFGAGAGGGGINVTGGAGGGGLGAGGDIFVQQGPTLVIEGGTLGAATATGGTGSTAGGGFGAGIFLEGTQDQTLAPGLGQTLSIDGAIADQSGSGGTAATAGSGGLIIDGAGTTALNAIDTYTGGTSLEAGILVLGAPTAAGTGGITFVTSDIATLDFARADTPTNILYGFAAGDQIDVTNVLSTTTLIRGTSLVDGTLEIPNSGATLAIRLDPDANYTADNFLLTPDGSGGTTVAVFPAPATPGTPVLAPASDSGLLGDDITDVTTPDITGTGSPGETIFLYDGTIEIGTGTVAESGTWSITTAILSLGTQTLTATQAVEVADNVSTASAPLALTIVATPSPPGLLTLAPASDSGVLGDDITNVTTPDITGTGIPGETITLYDGTMEVGAGTVANSGTWSIVSSTLIAGTHTLTATQADGYGDISAPSTLALTIDTTLPSAPTGLTLDTASDTGTKGDDITNDVTPIINGEGIAGETILLYDGTIEIGTGTVSAGGTWAIVTAVLLPGTHDLTATETDLAGNVSPASSALPLLIGTGGPTAPGPLALATASDSGILGDGITNVTTPTITGTGLPYDTVIVYDGTVEIGTATVGTDGTWSAPITTPFAAGTYTLTATQTDLQGNISEASAAFALTIDTTTPATPTIIDDTEVTNPAEPVVSGTATPNTTVTIYDNGSAVGTASVDGSGNWSFAFPTVLVAGTYSVTATDIDVAGNQSAASTSVTIKVGPSGAYLVVAPPTEAGVITSNDYDSSGTLIQVVKTNTAGQLLQSVSDSEAILEIYDSAGNLIGTITQPSTSPFTQPVFVTAGEPFSAITGSGTIGSSINLIDEDNIITSQGNDTVSAGVGADTINATGPTILITGGSGTLLFTATTTAATVTGGTGTSTLFGGTGGGYLQGGSAGTNILLAGGGNTTLVGGGAADTLVAAAGNAVVVMQSQSVAFGGSGSSTILGGNNGYIAGGTGSSLMVASNTGTDQMWGGSGSNTLLGAAGSDVLVNADGGATTMVGGTGNSLFVEAGGTALVYGGGGNDTFLAYGNSTMTVVEGNGNNEAMFGSGAMTVYGGTGTDLYDFVLGNGGGTDVINGFKTGTDQLRLYGYDVSTVQQTTAGGNTILTLSDGTSITLTGITTLPASSII